MYLVIAGVIFVFNVDQMGQGAPISLEYQFGTMVFLWLFFAPPITMRLLAEEQRMGTLELLLTSPVNDWEVVAGKFLGSLAVLLLTIAITFAYGLTLKVLGNADIGPMAAGYLGLFLTGAAIMSIGVLASAMTQNQVIAVLLSFAITLTLWVFSGLGQVLGNLAATQVFTQMAFFEHTQNFWRGVIDTNDIVYFLSLIALALFIATRVLETRRWR
jgi:ABC-2 type transport system permease protein